MDKVYKILLIEDEEDDAQLIQIELEKLNANFELQVIWNKEQLKRQLQNDTPDLIISDYNLPSFTGTDALALVREDYPNLPFILISGYIGEEKAVDAMLAGASDYAMKDNLNRLGAAIMREIKHYDSFKKNEATLAETRDRYVNLLESVNGIVWEADAETFQFTYISPQVEHILGFSPSVWKNKKSFWEDHIHPHDRKRVVEYCRKHSLRGEDHYFEYRMIDADNETVWLRDYVTVLTRDGSPALLRGLMVDITQEKKTERQRDKAYDLADIGHWELDLLHNRLSWSDLVKSLHEVGPGYKPNLETAINFYKEGEHRQAIRNAVDKAIKTGASFDVELKIITAKGNERWVRAVGETEFRDGTCIRIYGSTQNITKPKSVEQKLRDVVEYSTNMFYKHDTDHVLSFVSPQSEEFLGCSPSEARRKWTDFVTDHPINEEGFRKTQEAITTGKQQPAFPLQLRKKTGEIIWVRVNEAPITENGKTVAIVGSLTDITAQMMYQKELEELALVASKTTDVIIITDAEQRITWVNNAFEELTGYTYNEVIGKVPGNFLQGPETDPHTVRNISAAIQHRQSIQETILNYSKSGEAYWLELTIDPIFNDDGECKGFIAIEKDVTKKIIRQQKLQESVERYDIVAKATSDTIWDLNIESQTIRYNQNIYNMFGYEKTDVDADSKWWHKNIHPADRDDVKKEIEKALEHDTTRFQLEYRFQCADGSYKYIQDRAFIVTEEGTPVRIIGAMQDVTDFRQEKKWLQLFQSAIANINESVAIVEGDTSEQGYREIMYVNEAFTAMTGYSFDDAKGQSMEALIAPPSNQRVQQKLAKALETGQSCEDEFINHKKSGEKYWTHMSLVLIEGANDAQYWVCIGRETTEKKHHEHVLKESLKEKETLLLEIHHRVKNNLAVVSGMMQLQAFNEENESLKEKLYNGVTRIQTMGNIHELLYKSESFSELPFHENLRILANQIKNTLSREAALETYFDLHDVNLNINQAIPCSLIANEVITNIIKHAFSDHETYQLRIALSEEHGIVSLEIEDNGADLPVDFNRNGQADSLGLKLIDTLSQQLNATYEYVRLKQGTLFRLTFEKAHVTGIGSAHLN